MIQRLNSKRYHKMARKHLLLKSTTYSTELDDFVYCVIDRTLVRYANHGDELRELRRRHDQVNQVEWLGLMLNGDY